MWDHGQFAVDFHGGRDIMKIDPFLNIRPTTSWVKVRGKQLPRGNFVNDAHCIDR